MVKDYFSILIISRKNEYLGSGMNNNSVFVSIFWIWLSLSCVHMIFYIQSKGYTVIGNQGSHYKLNQIQEKYEEIDILIGRC